MDFILQISKKKSVTVWKKIGTLTFPFLFLIQSAFESVCDYFEALYKIRCYVDAHFCYVLCIHLDVLHRYKHV